MKAQLQNTLNHVAGLNVEITVLGKRMSMIIEGQNDKAVRLLKEFFTGREIEVSYDEELNETFLYLELN